MNISITKHIDGKKFVWDGKKYENKKEADGIAASYEQEGFTVYVIKENESYLVYSRRITTVQTNES